MNTQNDLKLTRTTEFTQKGGFFLSEVKAH